MAPLKSRGEGSIEAFISGAQKESVTRIAESFARLRRERRRGFIPFITAGDPDIGTTGELIVELARAGATCIELGVPFSDPVADGPVIQRASERALAQGVGVDEVLQAVARARKETDVPIVLFSYYNPLLQYGLERLAQDARTVGIDGVLVTDLVPEEAAEWIKVLHAHELDSIFLAAPTSTDERLRLIAAKTSGFIYAVSRTGVTGERAEVSAQAARLVARLRRLTDLPIAVGFGISRAEHVAEVWQYADAAVVGSAVVAEIARLTGAPDLVRRVGAFARSLLPTSELPR
jgi:tryptophan synthase alpha chain